MEQTHPNDSSPQEQDKALFNGIDWFKNFLETYWISVMKPIRMQLLKV